MSQGAAEADDRHLRLLAEFDNYRRRTAKDHEAARREGRRAALLPLDPHLHEAVAAVPADDEVAPGTVGREVRRGWRLGDELLRPAQVVVATAKEPADRWR